MRSIKVFLSTAVSLILLCFLSLSMSGCKIKTEKSVKKIDKYYQVIRLVITDPEVWNLLTPKQKAELRVADTAYKEARKIARSTNNKTDLHGLLMVGIGVLDSLYKYENIPKRHLREISIIRTSAKIFLTLFTSDKEIEH